MSIPRRLPAVALRDRPRTCNSTQRGGQIDRRDLLPASIRNLRTRQNVEANVATESNNSDQRTEDTMTTDTNQPDVTSEGTMNPDNVRY